MGGGAGVGVRVMPGMAPFRGVCPLPTTDTMATAATGLITQIFATTTTTNNMLGARMLLPPVGPLATAARRGALGVPRAFSSARMCRSSDKPFSADDPFVLPFHPAVDPQAPKDPHAPSQPSNPAELNEALSSAYQLEGLGTWAPIRVPGRTRDHESRRKRLARLIYQTRKRGILETDLILSTWAKNNLHNLNDDELDEFDRLLDEPDWDIFYWCTERKEPPERWQDSFKTEGRVGHRLVIHTRNEDRVIRRMPEVPPSADPPQEA